MFNKTHPPHPRSMHKLWVALKSPLNCSDNNDGRSTYESKPTSVVHPIAGRRRKLPCADERRRINPGFDGVVAANSPSE